MVDLKIKRSKEFSIDLLRQAMNGVEYLHSIKIGIVKQLLISGFPGVLLQFIVTWGHTICYFRFLRKVVQVELLLKSGISQWIPEEIMITEGNRGARDWIPHEITGPSKSEYVSSLQVEACRQTSSLFLRLNLSIFSLWGVSSIFFWLRSRSRIGIHSGKAIA